MNEQSNTQEGAISVIANEALTGLEGYLAVLTEDTNVLEAKLPDTVTDLALFVIVEGAAAGSYAELMPLEPGRNVRVELEGTCNPGDILRLYTPDGSNDGKVCAIGATAGLYFSPGVAEEEGVDGQLVLMRPMPRLVSVTSAHVADPASAAAVTAVNPAAATSHTITDGSTGTASTTALEEVTQAGNVGSADLAPVENNFATLAAELVLVKADLAAVRAEVVKLVTDVAAVRTGSEANNTAIDSINAALAEQKVTAAS